MSRDGARLDVGLNNATGVLDIDSGRLDSVALRGEVTDDGRAAIGLTAEPSPELRRHEFADATGARDVTYPSLPSGWRISAQRLPVAIDDTGRHVAVVGVNAEIGKAGVFVLDTAASTWTQPPGATIDDVDTSTWGVQFSADGSTMVVRFHTGAAGSQGWDEIWHIGPDGTRQLVNPSADGSAARTGDSHLVDVTPDGRYVLFGSTSLDLADAAGNLYGVMFVRDVATGTTSPVRHDVVLDVGAISDDGRVVAFSGGSDGKTPRVGVRVDDSWTIVRPTPLEGESGEFVHGVAMNGRGTRVASTGGSGDVYLVDFDGTGR